MSERILGVLGGMGPLASAHFMVRLTELTPAACDQEHIRAVLWSDPTIPDRTQNRFAGGPDPLPALLRGLNGLKAAGCGAVAIPCNTAHGWYEEMLAAGLPILHIVDAAAAQLARVLPSGTVGVMGTSATLAMRLYQERLEARGWQVIVPDEQAMAEQVMPAIRLVKAGHVGDAYAPLAATAQALIGRGAQAVVLGCTEIPLGMKAGPAEQLGVPLIDTIDALALAAIAWARGGALSG